MSQGYGFRRAADADRSAVVATIVEAYRELPVSRWLVPDAAQRPVVLYADAATVVDRAMTVGQVWTVADGAAVAVWLPHRPDTAPTQDYWFTRVCGAYADRFRTLHDEVDARRPDTDHLVLAFLAVEPARQGAGLGSGLLRHQVWQCSHDGTAAFAVAGTLAARQVLQRNGFRDRRRIDLSGRVQVWPMWRTPGLPLPASARPE